MFIEDLLIKFLKKRYQKNAQIIHGCNNNFVYLGLNCYRELQNKGGET